MVVARLLIWWLDMSALDNQVGGDHYKRFSIQPIEYCLKNNLGPAETHIIGYVTRWKDKGGIQDLEKALHMLEILIEFEKAREESVEADKHKPLNYP